MDTQMDGWREGGMNLDGSGGQEDNVSTKAEHVTSMVECCRDGCIAVNLGVPVPLKGRKEIFHLTTHSTHF